MRSLLTGFSLFAFISFLIGQPDTLKIPFSSSFIKLDGKSDDWHTLPIIIPGGGKRPYQNTNKAAMSWNEDNLFVIFYIKDQQLCYHETGDQNARLYLNDGVEIYIDSKADSEAVMDKNDYQFLVSIPESSVVFKGDKFLLNKGHLVPKDSENHTAIFQKKVLCTGTINQINDFDIGYCIEIAIPWSTIGLSPYSGMKLKIDLCVNDIDTLVDMAAIPDDWHPMSMNYSNLQGKNDYGFPGYWTEAILGGGPGLLYDGRKLMELYWPYVYVCFFIILGITIRIIFIQYQKLQFYKNFPGRHQLNNQMLAPMTDATSFIVEDHLPESIIQIRNYILTNIDKNISLQDLCGHLHISTRQMQRLTKEHCQMSPVQLINVLKMEEAAKRLKNSVYTVSEIAYGLGFENAGYFSQLFKKYYGLTPGEFRKIDMVK